MSECNILIIDDDLDDVEILGNAFKSCGVASVHYVNSAIQAFIYLEGQKKEGLPKLIVTDMYLPGINGAQFRKDLKGLARYKHIPIVVLSTLKKEQDIEKYRRVDVDYFLKPSTIEDYIKVAISMKTRAGL